jgi:tripartite-type tricarboxylate transporter receptor subunit TctC
MFFLLTSRTPFLKAFLWIGVALGFTAPHLASSREKPVRVIVPFAPGGGSDTLARFLVREINASSLDSSPWVVINVPGAGGTIGSRQAKNAHPGGHTLLFLHDGILTAQLSGKATYGPEAFAPVAMTGKVGMVVCVGQKSGMLTITDLIAKAKDQPDTVTFAANLGAPSFYLGQLLENRYEGCRFRYVQSGGGARRFADLTGGHVEVSAFSVSEYLSFRDGGIRALAYLGDQRHPALPEVSTARESDIDITYENLQGWWAPRNTPPAIIESQKQILKKAFHSASVQEALQQQSIDNLFLDSKAFRTAVAQKKEILNKVAQSTLTLAPPRLDIVFCGLGMLSLILFGLVKKSASEPSEVETPSLSLPRAAAVLLLFAGYVTALSLTTGWFLWLSGAFLLILFLRRPVISRQTLLLLVPSVVIPTVLFFFIEKLLGLPLP